MSLPKHSNAALNGYFDDDIGDKFFEETLGEDWNLEDEEKELAKRLETCAQCSAPLDPEQCMFLGVALADGAVADDAEEVKLQLPTGNRVRAVVLDDRDVGIVGTCSESCSRALRDALAQARPETGDGG
jgi:hypothetical protein